MCGPIKLQQIMNYLHVHDARERNINWKRHNITWTTTCLAGSEKHDKLRDHTLQWRWHGRMRMYPHSSRRRWNQIIHTWMKIITYTQKSIILIFRKLEQKAEAVPEFIMTRSFFRVLWFEFINLHVFLWDKFDLSPSNNKCQ